MKDDRHIRLEYMGAVCVVCGLSIKAVERRYLTSKGSFEFNHIDPSRKSPIYDKLIRRVISPEQLDELDKCNLLCRNCHAIWTNQQFRGKSRITLTLPDGRIVKRKISFHGLIEIKKGTPKFYFFADESCHIEIYCYRLGKSEKPIYRVGFELEKDLNRLMLATRRRRTLRVWDKKGLVFIAERFDPENLRIRYPVRFPLMQATLIPDDPKSPHIWVRNGKIIIRKQGVKKTGLITIELAYSELERALKHPTE